MKNLRVKHTKGVNRAHNEVFISLKRLYYYYFSSMVYILKVGVYLGVINQ